MRLLLAALLFCITLCQSACEVKVKTDPSSEDTATDSKIRNGIKIEEQADVMVEQAFLTYEDGTLVDKNNRTNVNKKIILNLVIDGWRAKNGQVALEASQRITTSEQEVIYKEDKLFAMSGIRKVSPEDAKYVKLNVVITMVNELVDYYHVEFKVWNKQFNQSLSGSYKFYIG